MQASKLVVNVRRWGGVLFVALMFIVAVELMKRSAHELQPLLASTLPHFVDSGLSALGAAWASAYIMVSGSVVAAISLAFFDSGLVSESQLAMMLFGSRFGAAGVVVAVGLFDAAQNRSVSMEDGASMGLLTFIATFAIGLPAAALTWAWTFFHPTSFDIEVASSSVSPDAGPFRALAGLVVEQLGGVPSFLAAVVLLVASLKLFDTILEYFDLAALTQRASSILSNRFWAALFGLGMTLLTTSVAFSVATLVPLFNRDVLERKHILPYIVGANIGTMGDTLVISLLLDKPGGLVMTLVVIGSIAVVTVLALLLYERFNAFVFECEERLTGTRWATLATLIALVLTPLGLVGLSWL